jgi:hypothetical protein
VERIKRISHSSTYSIHLSTNALESNSSHIIASLPRFVVSECIDRRVLAGLTSTFSLSHSTRWWRIANKSPIG